MNAKLIEFPRVRDPRGNLTFVENSRHIPFDISRVYYLYDVPGGESRGGHAHKNLQQVLIAVAGSFDVILDSGKEKRTYTLSKAFQGLYIPKMTWRELNNFSSGAVCLAMVSNFFDEQDYFRNYSDFLKAIQ
jgi:dTDP-4-dehydrorhamnose 3,5-epimerase-like enzyme